MAFGLMMVTRGDRTATGVLLKGVDPDLMRKVLDGGLEGIHERNGVTGTGAVPLPNRLIGNVLASG